MFDRVGHYLIDYRQMHLVNTEKGTVHRFDFSDMVVRKITHQSKAASPIRYDETVDKMMIWKQRKWQPIGEGQEAIMMMFNKRVESELLDG